MSISAQVSLYPLRRAELSPTIDRATDAFRKRGLRVSAGDMSTVVVGDCDAVFAALKDAFRKTAEQGDIVMVVTISNACPSSNDRPNARCGGSAADSSLDIEEGRLES